MADGSQWSQLMTFLAEPGAVLPDPTAAVKDPWIDGIPHWETPVVPSNDPIPGYDFSAPFLNWPNHPSPSGTPYISSVVFNIGNGGKGSSGAYQTFINRTRAILDLNPSANQTIGNSVMSPLSFIGVATTVKGLGDALDGWESTIKGWMPAVGEGDSDMQGSTAGAFRDMLFGLVDQLAVLGDDMGVSAGTNKLASALRDVSVTLETALGTVLNDFNNWANLPGSTPLGVLTNTFNNQVQAQSAGTDWDAWLNWDLDADPPDKISMRTNLGDSTWVGISDKHDGTDFAKALDSAAKDNWTANLTMLDGYASTFFDTVQKAYNVLGQVLNTNLPSSGLAGSGPGPGTGPGPGPNVGPGPGPGAQIPDWLKNLTGPGPGPGPGPGATGPGANITGPGPNITGPGPGANGPGPGANITGPGPGANITGPGPGANITGPGPGANGPGSGIDIPNLIGGPGPGPGPGNLQNKSTGNQFGAPNLIGGPGPGPGGGLTGGNGTASGGPGPGSGSLPGLDDVLGPPSLLGGAPGGTSGVGPGATPPSKLGGPPSLISGPGGSSGGLGGLGGLGNGSTSEDGGSLVRPLLGPDGATLRTPTGDIRTVPDGASVTPDGHVLDANGDPLLGPDGAPQTAPAGSTLGAPELINHSGLDLTSGGDTTGGDTSGLDNWNDTPALTTSHGGATPNGTFDNPLTGATTNGTFNHSTGDPALTGATAHVGNTPSLSDFQHRAAALANTDGPSLTDPGPGPGGRHGSGGGLGGGTVIGGTHGPGPGAYGPGASSYGPGPGSYGPGPGTHGSTGGSNLFTAGGVDSSGTPTGEGSNLSFSGDDTGSGGTGGAGGATSGTGHNASTPYGPGPGMGMGPGPGGSGSSSGSTRGGTGAPISSRSITEELSAPAGSGRAGASGQSGMPMMPMSGGPGPGNKDDKRRTSSTVVTEDNEEVWSTGNEDTGRSLGR